MCLSFLLKRKSMYFSLIHSPDVLGVLKIGQLSGWGRSGVHQYAGCSSLL